MNFENFSVNYEKKIYQCHLCLKNFLTWRAFFSHAKKIHETVVTKMQFALECSHCRRKFLSKVLFERHCSSCHSSSPSERKKLHQCPVCEAVFLDRLSCVNHTQKLHPEHYNLRIEKLNQRKIFKCDYCVKKFTREDYRVIHEKRCKIHNSIKQDSSVEASTSASNHEGRIIYTQAAGTNATQSTEQYNSPTLDTSAEDPNIKTMPTLTHHLRDQKQFLQSHTRDFSTSRRSSLNSKNGKGSIVSYKLKIATLQQKIRRMKKKLVSLEDVIRGLKENNKISDTLADTILVNLLLIIREPST